MFLEILLDLFLIGAGAAVSGWLVACHYEDKLTRRYKWSVGEESIVKQMERDGWTRP